MVSEGIPTGPYICPIRPLGRANDWNFRECTFVSIVNHPLIFPGLEMGLTVPSTKPKQLGNGAPFL